MKSRCKVKIIPYWSSILTAPLLKFRRPSLEYYKLKSNGYKNNNYGLHFNKINILKFSYILLSQRALE